LGNVDTGSSKHFAALPTFFRQLVRSADMKHMIAATLLALGTSTANADIPLLTIETLMHAQAEEALALSIVAPTSATTALQYSFSANTNDGSFAYQALAGQTYNGLSYSLSGQGSFNPGTQTYTWSASGMLGAQAWAQTGQAQWVGDPTASISGNVSLNDEVIGTFSGTVEVDGVGNSSGTGTFTPKGGSPGTYNVTDKVPGGTGQPWTLIWEGHPAQFQPVHAAWVTASSDGGIYQGTSTMTLVAVPEPSAWIMVGVGMLVLLGKSGRVRRSFAA
jgi:hypothetical protein